MSNYDKYQMYKLGFHILNQVELNDEKSEYNFVDINICFAVACVVESIISDRIASFLGSTERFFILIQEWKAQTNEPIVATIETRNGVVIHSDDLIEDVDRWRQARNEVVHGLVKYIPKPDHKGDEEFEALLQQTAQQGVRLARLVRKVLD